MRIDVNNNERSCSNTLPKNQFGMLNHSYYGSTILQYKLYKNVYYGKIRYGKIRYGRLRYFFDPIPVLGNLRE